MDIEADRARIDELEELKRELQEQRACTFMVKNDLKPTQARCMCISTLAQKTPLHFGMRILEQTPQNPCFV